MQPSPSSPDSVTETSDARTVTDPLGEVLSARGSHVGVDVDDDVVIDITEAPAAAPTRSPRAMSGRVVVVNGGASEIGRAVALSMVDAGARVCIIGRDVDRLRETAAAAGASAPILYLQCDVGSVSEIEGVVEFIERFDRPIDVLVHASGVQVAGGIASGAVSDLDEQYLVNVRGPYLLSQKLLPLLREARGHVVFVNQSLRVGSVGEFGQFSVTKAAVTALADALRSEVEHDGVRVTTVHPGPVAPADADVDSLRPVDVAESVLHAVQRPTRVQVADLSVGFA